jgi:hypothetical protein
MRRVPNFFILGAPKCGTSSLAAWLREHPQAFMSAWKEPRYFDRDLAAHWRVDEAGYERLFEDVEPQHVVVGEATPWYLYSHDAVANILEVSEGARFVVGIRNPADLAHALWEQLRMDNTEQLRDFGEAWHASPARREGREAPRKVAEPRLLDYQSTCRLGEQVERLLAQVPRDRVHVFRLDDLRADPGATYRGVLDFLDLPDDGRDEFPVWNSAKEIRWRWLQPGISAARKAERIAKSKLGRPPVNSAWMRRLNQLNRTTRPRTPVAPELRAEIEDHFAADVELLARVTGLDLSGWAPDRRGRSDLAG